MVKKSFHIIGAGKVGQAFAAILQRSGWQLSAVCSPHHADRIVWQSGTGVAVRSVGELPFADVVLVTTRDDVIETAAAELAACAWLDERVTVVHTSGAKTAAALAAAAERGAVVGALHPVFAFSDVEHAVAHLSGSLCALEGDVWAMAVLQDLAAALGLRAFAIRSEQKVRYHAAMSAAANFTVALSAYAQDVLAPLGLPPDLRAGLVGELMAQNLAGLQGRPSEQALTGPIVRGDAGTVAAHLAVLTESETDFYCAAARQTLRVAERSGRLPSEAAESMRSLLLGVQANAHSKIATDKVE